MGLVFFSLLHTRRPHAFGRAYLFAYAYAVRLFVLPSVPLPNVSAVVRSASVFDRHRTASCASLRFVCVRV